jgi:hypothetical protein
MRESLYHNTKHVLGMTSAAISTNTTTNAGASVDMAQSGGGTWRSVLFLVTGGTITDGSYLVKVMDSSDNVTFADVADTGYVQGPSGAITATGGTAEIAYAGNKRYVRLSVVSTGVTIGGAISARAILHGTTNELR